MGIRMDHVTEDHVSHLFRFDCRTIDCLADHGGSQLRRGFVLQASTIGSNSGANTAQDHDSWLYHLLSPLLLLVFSSFAAILRFLPYTHDGVDVCHRWPITPTGIRGA